MGKVKHQTDLHHRGLLIILFIISMIMSIPMDTAAQTGTKEETQGEPLPRITVFEPVNEEKDPRYDELCSTIAETVALNLTLIGEHRVNETEREAIEETADIAAYARENQVDNVVFGRLFEGEGGRIMIEMSVFSRANEEVTMSETVTAESYLDIFDASDRMVTALIGAFSDRHIAYGSLVLQNRGTEADYIVKVGQNTLGKNIERIPRMLTGTYTVTIVQERVLETITVEEEEIEIGKDEQTVLDFELPFITRKEADTFRSIDRRIWSGWDEDGKSEQVLASFEQALELTSDEGLGPGIARLHHRYSRWKGTYLESRQTSGKSPEQVKKPFPAAYYSPETEPHKELHAEPVGSLSSRQEYRNLSTAGTIGTIGQDPGMILDEGKQRLVYLDVQTGGGTLGAAGVNLAFLDRHLRCSVLAGAGYATTGVKLAGVARASLYIGKGVFAPSFSLTALSITDFDIFSLSAGASIGFEIRFKKVLTAIYLENNILANVVPYNGLFPLIYMPAVGVKL